MFGIKVKVFNVSKKEYDWFWLHPTGEPRYKFDTEYKAQRIREMCYPETTNEWVRIVKITD